MYVKCVENHVEIMTCSEWWQDLGDTSCVKWRDDLASFTDTLSWWESGGEHQRWWMIFHGIGVRLRDWPINVWHIVWSVKYSVLLLPHDLSVPEKEKKTSQSQWYSYSHAKEVETDPTGEKIKPSEAFGDALSWQHIAFIHACGKLCFWGNGPLPTWQTSKYLFTMVLSTI